ncbi:glycosyltransferase [Salinisphaera sp. SPP-AMP-43]|uniref:glycosyltransferase n=1 Tax=Salinisphaera sp. SPP-AMP-43 TaxID=3121288 RepID=UPI003C6DB7DC
MSAPPISTIVAVRQGMADILACLEPLAAMRERGEIAEIVVVDDASSDDTAQRAEAGGADHVIRLEHRAGPGGARNRGVAASHAPLLWFVDADVVVHHDAARLLSQSFEDERIDALFGAYGDRPMAENFLSQYKNLIHHDTHQRAAGPATTFWTGCGAVRREAFDAVGGFDAEGYRDVGMEDVDFGYRLNAAGYRIQLDPSLQGEHRKRWTLFNLLRVEILHRALPWSRLMLSHPDTEATLNVDRGERRRAVIAGLAVIALLGAATPWAGWPLALAAVALVAGANRRLFSFFRAKRGPWFAVRAVAFHQLYYLYSGATFVYAWLEQRLRRD